MELRCMSRLHKQATRRIKSKLALKTLPWLELRHHVEFRGHTKPTGLPKSTLNMSHMVMDIQSTHIFECRIEEKPECLVAYHLGIEKKK